MISLDSFHCINVEETIFVLIEHYIRNMNMFIQGRITIENRSKWGCYKYIFMKLRTVYLLLMYRGYIR